MTETKGVVPSSERLIDFHGHPIAIAVVEDKSPGWRVSYTGIYGCKRL